MERLEQLVEERGLDVFARIDHAAGALRPTELLIFGCLAAAATAAE
jgi:uncharacterized protein (DUF302 family)